MTAAPGPSLARTTLSVAAVAAASVIAWFAGVVAQAQYLEDLCFDDVVGEGSYRSGVRGWPPSYRCHVVDGDGTARTVDHHLIGWLVVTWPFVVLAAAIVVLAFARRIFAARPAPPRDRPVAFAEEWPVRRTRP